MRKLAMIVASIVVAYPAYADNNCNTPAVQERYLELSCQNLAGINQLGIATCSELKKLSNSDLSERVHAKFEQEQVQPANEAEKQYLSYLEKSSMLRFAGARDLIEGATFVAIDYDKNLKRYTCQAFIQINIQAATNWMFLTLLLKAEEDAQYKLMLNTLLKQNNVRVSKMLIEQALAPVSEAVTIWKNAMAKGVKFYVQPKDPNAWLNSEFIITDTQ